MQTYINYFFMLKSEHLLPYLFFYHYPFFFFIQGTLQHRGFIPQSYSQKLFICPRIL